MAWTLASAWGLGSLQAAPFRLPEEGPIPFRRDRLLLDADTLSRLADDLNVVALGLSQDSPETRRKSAQALALSLAVSPAKGGTRELLAAYAKGERPARPERRTLDQSQKRIRKISEWLESAAAGEDGQALGACLGDVAFSTAADQELGLWQGWIPDLTGYEEVKPVEDKTVTAEKPALERILPPVTLALESATIATALWIVDQEGKTLDIQRVEVAMKAAVLPDQEGEERKAMEFSVEHSSDARIITRMNRSVGSALKKQLGPLPAGVKVTLDFGKDYIAQKNREAISGAAAVLVAASITGKEPVGTVVGEISADGVFKTGPNFWDQLQALSKTSGGGRLVIPADGAEFLPSLLAMETPEFFMKYDVLLASNLGELLERTAKTPSEPLAAALGKFQDIRAKTNSAVSQYVANRFIRQRLAEAGADLPYFASPRLLAIQGAGERPTKIPRRVLACELRRAIQPLRWATGIMDDEIDLGTLDQSYERSRAAIDALDRYVETADRDFFTRARDMTTTLRAYSRARRMSSRDDSYEIIESARIAMRKAVSSVSAELAKAAAGPELPAPAPEAEEH